MFFKEKKVEVMDDKSFIAYTKNSKKRLKIQFQKILVLKKLKTLKKYKK